MSDRKIAFPGPPLLLVSRLRLSISAIDNIRGQFERAAETGFPLVVDGGCVTMFQLIEGRWQPLLPEPAGP